MRHIIVMGRTGCGKTTLLQRLMEQPIEYKKTYAIEVCGDAIDTPGEYMDHKKLFHSLLVTCTDAEAIVLLHEATDSVSTFFPGMSTAFQIPVIGVVSKTDLATEEQIRMARNILELAGADIVFNVSSFTDNGVNELRDFLCSDLSELKDKKQSI